MVFRPNLRGVSPLKDVRWPPTVSTHLSFPPLPHPVLLCSPHSLSALDLKAPPGAVYRGPPKDGVKPGCTLTVSDADFISIAAGNLSAQKVGKLTMVECSGAGLCVGGKWLAMGLSHGVSVSRSVGGIL